jgi:hypothetical protein
MIKTLVFLVTFALLASPAYFRALRSVLGGSVASPDGLARPAGLFIAGLVFIVVLYMESRVTSGFKRSDSSFARAARAAARASMKKGAGSALSAAYIAARGIGGLTPGLKRDFRR